MAKKDSLATNITLEPDVNGNVTYNAEVIAVIAGIAAGEIEGITNMISSGSFSDFTKKSRNVTKGIKIELGTEEVSVDIYVSMEYGTPIQKAAFDVQNNIKKAIESMTGLHVVRVDVHILAVSFEKENEEIKNLTETLKPTKMLQEASEE
ncbi:MAG: Asp23/Gls24 family envelope stress response protein [Eubacteriales bacterium]|nr:Asp23/Gls24 family envelope stress response protein [Eubacteriales bacterium]